MPTSPKISTCLWYDGQAAEAAGFYVSVFGDARIVDTMHMGERGPAPAGSVLAVTFELAGRRFIALNGGPQYKLTEAASIFVECETQNDVDYYWRELSAGGKEQPCGWLKDRFGLSWQIVPAALGRMLQDKDAARARRAMECMLQMKKIDINEIQEAFDGK